MNCKNCNAELEDGVVFCGSCGARVDGRKACPKCGQFNEKTQKFCSYCGARVDGKTVCKNCGAEYVGAFCSECGAKSNEIAAAKPIRVARDRNLGKIMETVAKSVAFFGAMLALIFILFIGFNVKVKAGSFKESEPIVKNIFYYFGDNMDRLDVVKEMLKYDGLEGWRKAWMICDIIVPLVVSVVGLALAVTFAVIAIVRFVKSFSQENDTINVSLKVIAVYVITAVVLFSFNKESYKGQGYVERMVFNEATVTGMILCLIACLGVALCKLIARPADFRQKKILKKVIVAACATSVSLAALIVAANTGVRNKVDGEKSVVSAWILAENSKGDFISGCIAMLFLMLTLIFFVLSLFENFKSVFIKDGAVSRVEAWLSFIFGLIAGVGLYACGGTQSIVPVSSLLSMALFSIVGFFGLLNLVMTITNSTTSKKEKETE